MNYNALDIMLEARKTLTVLLGDEILAPVAKFELQRSLKELNDKILLEQSYALPTAKINH